MPMLKKQFRALRKLRWMKRKKKEALALLLNLNSIGEENYQNEDLQLQIQCMEMEGKCSICLTDIDLNNLETESGSLIDKQVTAIYLVRYLLGVPFEECTKYLKKYGHPATWLSLCSSCCSISKKAFDIHEKILKLQNKVECLKCNMTDKMKVKIEEPEWEVDEQGPMIRLTAAYEIRKFIKYANVKETNEETNEEDADDLPNLVTPLLVNTKCKANSMYFDESEEMNTTKYESDDFDWEPDFEQSPTVESNQMTDWVQYEKSDDDEIPKRRKTRQRRSINCKPKSAVKEATKFKENNSRQKNYRLNECPICFKIYDSKLKWRMHIRRSHKQYLFHLYKQVPEGHICLPGECFPYSSTETKKIKKGETAKSGVITTKIPTKREESQQLIVSLPKVSVSEGSSSLKSLKTISNKKKEQLEDAEKKDPTKSRAKRGRTKSVKKDGKSVKPKKTMPPKVFHCKQCTETFSSNVDLNFHINRTHTVGIKCQTCGKVLVTVRSMENHTRSMHRPKSDSICLGCKKSYPITENYYEHLKKSEACKEHVVKCSESDCSRVFPSLQAVEVHLELRHIARPPPFFKCSVCGKAFTEKTTLKGHELTHHVEKDELPYPCEKCGKKFPLLRAMKLHLQTVHLNKEPGGESYPCPVCNRVFTTKSHLRRHKMLHNEESPYLCTVCGKAYKVFNQLTTHMWSHDPDRYEKYSLYQYKNKTKKKNEETKKRKKVFLDTKRVNIEQDLSLPNPSSSAFESTVPTDTIENIPSTSTSNVTTVLTRDQGVLTSDSGSLNQPIPVNPTDVLCPFDYTPTPLPNLTLVTYSD